MNAHKSNLEVLTSDERTSKPKGRAPSAEPIAFDTLMKPSEVAAVLGLSESAVTKRIARGQIPAVRLGERGYRVKASVLAKYLDDLPEV